MSRFLVNCTDPNQEIACATPCLRDTRCLWWWQDPPRELVPAGKLDSRLPLEGAPQEKYEIELPPCLNLIPDWMQQGKGKLYLDPMNWDCILTLTPYMKTEAKKQRACVCVVRPARTAEPEKKLLSALANARREPEVWRMMKRTLIFLTTTISAAFVAFGAPEKAEKKPYPDHWGDPPKIQTRDLRLLPGGYGTGSGTLAKWIQKNLDDDAAGLKPLFDGKSLDAFEIKSGTATYELKGGVITGTTKPGSPNTFLCTKQHYGDFELHFEVKCHNKLNSGVQIRSALKGDKHGGRVNGPQVEIEASGAKGAEAGYLYAEAVTGWMTPAKDRKPHKHFKDDQWNHYKVVAEGPRIQVWVNGEQVSDLVDENIFKSHPKGLIGLQVHSVGGKEPLTVSWRDLKIREITK